MDIKHLELLANENRKRIVQMIYKAKAGHPGGSLSVIDILTAIYEMDVDFSSEKRSKVVLSKGHAVPAQYAVLASKGIISEEELGTFRQVNSRLQGHPHALDIKEVDATTGLLGQGLSIAVGMALVKKHEHENNHVYAILGDGEMQEGQIWESLLQASHYADNTLGDFLEGITLASDIDNLEEEQDSVTLMTLHSAKGLEFPVVFLVGMEEGIFPGYKSISEPKELEEERRLCYVGITRAKNDLFLTCAKRRTIFGSTSYNSISRFITEIPSEDLEGMEEIDGKKDNEFKDSPYTWEYGKVTKTKIEKEKIQIKDTNTQYQFRTAESFLNALNKKGQEDIDLSIYKAGKRVYHKKFGEGTINYVEKEGQDLKVDITFDKVGHKRLMAKFAGLEIIE